MKKVKYNKFHEKKIVDLREQKKIENSKNSSLSDTDDMPELE